MTFAKIQTEESRMHFRTRFLLPHIIEFVIDLILYAIIVRISFGATTMNYAFCLIIAPTAMLVTLLIAIVYFHRKTKIAPSYDEVGKGY